MSSRPSNVPATATAGRSLLRRGGADLHVHTTHSDGACSPCEVVVAAARVGLSALAITDHDTVSALAVARPEAQHWGVELVAGVELTCGHRGRELHILGYFIREDDPDLAAAMDALRAGRVHRFEAMAGRLRDLGLRVDLDAVRRAFPRAVLGRRHLADYLARTGQVSGLRQAFVQLPGRRRPGLRREAATGRRPGDRADRPDGRGRRAGASAPRLRRVGDPRPGRRGPAGDRGGRDPAAPAAWAVGSGRSPAGWASSASPAATSTPPTAPAGGSAPSRPTGTPWSDSGTRRRPGRASRSRPGQLADLPPRSRDGSPPGG